MLHNEGYGTQQNPGIGSLYFIIRILRNIFAGINISSVSFLAILSLIITGSFLTDISNSKTDLIFTLSFVATSAMVYSIVFNIIFFLSRITASFFSRFEKIWSLSAPGIFIFIIFAQPVYAYILGRSEGHSEIFFYIYMFIAIAIMIPILYIFPVFHGYNATFLVVSSLISRLLHIPLHANTIESGPYIFVISHLFLTVLSLTIFAALQIRYKLYLTPGFERIFVPKKIFLLAVSMLLVVPLYILFDPIRTLIIEKELYSSISVPIESLKISNVVIPSDYSENYILILFHFALATYFIFIVQWIITAVILVFRSKKSEENLAFIPSVIFFFVTILIVISSIFGLASINRLNQRSVASSEFFNYILDQTGAYFDFDGDHNSSFPGHDPDDMDPCIRHDVPLDYCEILTQHEDVSSNERIIPDKPVRFLTILTVEASYSASDLSKYLESSRYSKDDVMYTARRIPGVRTAFFTQKRILLPANRTETSLQALFRGMNGIEAYAQDPGKYHESIFSAFSMYGYRTICIMGDGKRSFQKDRTNVETETKGTLFESARATQLDSGCQIFEVDPILPAEGIEKSDDELSGFIRTSLRILDRYGEDRNVLWIHYKYKQMTKDPSGIHRALNSLLRHGDVVVLLMNPQESLYADLIHFSSRPTGFIVNDTVLKEKEVFYIETAAAAGFKAGEATAGMKTEPMIGVFYDDPARGFRWPIIGMIKHSTSKQINLPPVTYRSMDGKVIIYDGIRGITRTER